MTSKQPTPTEADLRRAALMGVVAGLRSQTPLAMLARAIEAGEIEPPGGVLGRVLGSPMGRTALKVSAVGECIGDKLPTAPSRLKPMPFLGRIGFGAISAAALAQTQGTPAGPAAVRGAAGAIVGSVGGYLFRLTGGTVTGLPDLAIALLEDAIAIGLARSAIDPNALADLAAESRQPSPSA